MANLVGRPLSTAALWARNLTSHKNHKMGDISSIARQIIYKIYFYGKSIVLQKTLLLNKKKFCCFIKPFRKLVLGFNVFKNEQFPEKLTLFLHKQKVRNERGRTSITFNDFVYWCYICIVNRYIVFEISSIINRQHLIVYWWVDKQINPDEFPRLFVFHRV